MKRSNCPAVLPALALAAGIEVSFRCLFLPLPLAVLLALLGLALGGRRGWGVVWLGAGLVAGVLAGGVIHRGIGEELPEGIVPGRPVSAALQVMEPWRRGEHGWSAWAQVESLRQGCRIVSRPRRVLLQLSGEETPPANGSRLRVKGTLGRRQAYLNRPLVPAGPWRLRVKSRRLLDVVGEPSLPGRVSNALRQRLEETLASVPKTPARGLARALVLGDSTEVPTRWRRALRRWGGSHLLAVSGLHVGLVAGVALLLGAWLPVPAQRLLMVLAALVYVLAVGPRPSVLRAAAMAALALAALTARRPPKTANALALFCAGSLLLEPPLLHSPGFLLSVTATAGLVGWAPLLARRWPRLPRLVAEPLGASCAAQLASSPLALPWFHLWVPAAPLFNLFLVPWAAVFLAAALAWTAVAVAVPSWGPGLWPILEAVASPLDGLAALPPHPWLAVPVSFGLPAAALGTLVVGALLWWPRRIGLGLAVLGLCLVLGGRFLPGLPSREKARGPELVMLDVGQGDAFLLRDSGRAMLVDGGGWSQGDFGGRALLPALAGLGVRRLDAVVLTHPDRDHCGGLEDIADYLPVAALWTLEAWLEAPCGAALLNRGIPILPLEAGDRVQLESWRLRVLHPVAADLRNSNASSVVLQAQTAGWRVLLTGDLDGKTERALVRSVGPSLASDVLKVSHHGSGGSSDPLFLRAVAPRLALISAGRGNAYGHPHRRTLQRLEREGSRVLRTDRSGMVRLRFQPGRLQISLGER